MAMENPRARSGSGSGSLIQQLTQSIGRRQSDTLADKPSLSRAKSMSNIRKPGKGLTDSSSPTDSPTASPKKRKKMSLNGRKQERYRSYSSAVEGSDSGLRERPIIQMKSDREKVTKISYAEYCKERNKQHNLFQHQYDIGKDTEKEVDYSLENVSKSPPLQHGFMNFLEKRFASENFRFYLACCEYSELREKEERKEKAREMVQDFVKYGAEYEVNMEDDLREEILSSYRKAEANLFCPAMAHVQGMMKEKLMEFQRYASVALFPDGA